MYSRFVLLSVLLTAAALPHRYRRDVQLAADSFSVQPAAGSPSAQPATSSTSVQPEASSPFGDLRVLVTRQGLSHASREVLRQLHTRLATRVRAHVQGAQLQSSSELRLGVCHGRATLQVKDFALNHFEVSRLVLAPSTDLTSLEVIADVTASFSGELMARVACGRWINVPQFDFNRWSIIMQRRYVSVDVDKELNFNAHVEGARFKVGASGGQSSDGTPEISVASCSSDMSLSDIDISFSGDALTSIYNQVAADRRVVDAMRSLSEELLTSQACDVLPGIFSKANEEMQKIPYIMRLPEDLGTLHWQLTEVLGVQANGVRLQAQGLVVPVGWSLNETRAALSDQAPINESALDPQRDVCVLLDSTLLNSALLAAHTAGHLHRDVPPRSMPRDLAPHSPSRIGLSIVCQGHNSEAPLRASVYTASAPKTEIHEDGIHIQMEVLADIIRNDTGKVRMTVSSSLDVTAEVSVDARNNVTFAVSRMQQTLRLVNCSLCESYTRSRGWAGLFGSLTAALGVRCGSKLREVLEKVEPALAEQVRGIVNELGGRGLQLPTIPFVRLSRPEVRYGRGTLAFVTNFEVNEE